MLARTTRELPLDAGWSFEPKYDGIRLLAFVARDSIALVTRNGNDKAAQFPEVEEALRALEIAVGQPLVLDGELVALRRGRVARFGALQDRMHLLDPRSVDQHATRAPAAFIAFDLLLCGPSILLRRPWRARRKALEKLLYGRISQQLRLSEILGSAEAALERARDAKWEGIVAKRTRSMYAPGKRSSCWLKLKLERRQEFVVGGYTAPRNSRTHFGALLLGYYDRRGRLVYAGHTGTGFSRSDLATLYRRLQPLERSSAPFATVPQTNQRAHWVNPKLVVEVKFNEWTREGRLRHPVYVGVRDDKNPSEIVREPGNDATSEPLAPGAKGGGVDGRADVWKVNGRRSPRGTNLLQQLREIESGSGDGVLTIDWGVDLAVTSLNKVFFGDDERHTKGDLVRYYLSIADCVLPAMRDRPLVLKRHPNGIQGESFYQQRVVDPIPAGVRAEIVDPDLDGTGECRLVGGSLATLLYAVQLCAISYDPWHSRVGGLDYADYTILDLDPGPEAPFPRVVEVAALVHEEMLRAGLDGALKTSGATGLHIYVPLPPETGIETARLVAQLIATRVANRHPDVATIERSRSKRPPGAVYVDYLQNILGKTVAGPYAVRARPGAPVSTPLGWHELTSDLDPKEFTIDTIPERISRKGDLWSAAMRRQNELTALAKQPERK